MRPALVWTNTGKYPSRKYQGRYIRDRRGERTFVLETLLRSGRTHRLSFESPQAARRDGWVSRK